MCLAPHNESAGILYGRLSAVQAQIIMEFLKGIQQVWTEAWDNNTPETLGHNTHEI